MNAAHMKDPAAGIPQQLLPHMHLVSKHRYPLTSNPSLESIVTHLLEAPKIVRDVQPMQWQLLDTPQDGSMLLTWQPLEWLGTNFASDGYIWADTEHVFKSEVRGYTLEMYLQRSGYRASGEAMASHSRRRYRLLPGNPNPNLPNPDPSLWLTHYSKASARDHVPAASIPVMPHVQAQIQQRRVIQTQGQLARKDFMLNDRANWPSIHLPPAMARAVGPGQMPAGAPAHRRVGSTAHDPSLEEEEDVSRGDILDFMSPRDISRMRYEQHHEWMEEVLESPYPTLSIIPSDLGLGRKGHLEDLTKDFFDAPVSARRDPAGGPPPRVGKMSPGKAEEFAKHAEAKLASMQVELDRMRKKHAQRMQKFHRITALNRAEKRLRSAPNVAEKRRGTNDMTDSSQSEPRDAVDEIVDDIEATIGKRVEKTTAVYKVSVGGLMEDQFAKPSPVTTQAVPQSTKSPEPAAVAAAAVGAGVAAGAASAAAAAATQSSSDQAAAPSQKEEQPDSVAASEPQPSVNSNAEATAMATKQEPSTDSNQQSEADIGHDDSELMEAMNADINMDGMDDLGGDSGDQNGSGNEWVMLDEDQHNGNDNMDASEPVTEDLPKPETTSAEVDTAGGDTATVEQPTSTSQPAATVPPPPSNDTPLDTPDFDMGGEFDTAGDALASYGDEGDDDLNLDNVEDSAFGDAFQSHGHDESMT